MNKKTNFDWYKFHEVGCALYETGGEENLRTAINRFYYGSFCQARDYLLNNNIFFNKTLKDDICSETGVVHEATRLIYKNEERKIDKKKGKKIHDWLVDLRENRNIVDYQSNININLNFTTKQSKSLSQKIFDTIENL